jgi:hypothetical protein
MHERVYVAIAIKSVCSAEMIQANIKVHQPFFVFEIWNSGGHEKYKLVFSPLCI